MSQRVQIRSLVNMPQWACADSGQRFMRGMQGFIVVGDGEGEIPETDLNGRLELGHVARVTEGGSGDDSGDDDSGSEDSPPVDGDDDDSGEPATAKKAGRRVAKSA